MGLIRYEEVNVESTRSGILDSSAISAREGISATFNCGLATVSVKIKRVFFFIAFLKSSGLLESIKVVFIPNLGKVYFRRL